MAKTSGIGMTVTVDDGDGTGRSIGTDIDSLTIGNPRGVQDVTSVTVAAMERLLLRTDTQITINGTWDAAANPSSFGVYSTHADNDSRTVVIVVGGKTFTVETILTDVSWDMGTDGSFKFTATHQLSNGVAAAWT